MPIMQSRTGERDQTIFKIGGAKRVEKTSTRGSQMNSISANIKGKPDSKKKLDLEQEKALDERGCDVEELLRNLRRQ